MSKKHEDKKHETAKDDDKKISKQDAEKADGEKDAIDEKLEAGGEIEGQPAGIQQGQEKLYSPRVGDVQARETDPEIAGTGTAEDGIHDVVESKEADRAATDTPAVTSFRRNLDDFTEKYQGQQFVCIATKGGAETVIGYTNDASGGGMIELVDASPDLKGPMIVRLTAEEKAELTQAAYAAAQK